MAENRLKTLLIITPGFPKNEADTTCIPPQQVFVKALKQVNPQLNIIVLSLTYPFFTATYQWHGIKVMAFGTKNKGRVFRVVSAIKMWRALTRLIKHTEIIGLLSFWLGKCAWIADKFAKRNHLKHHSWLLGQDAKAGNKYVNKIKPHPASLIAISDFVARGLQANYGILPSHVIPVGVDVAMFPQNNNSKEIDVLGVGSLIPLKQFSVFLEIVKCLKYYLPNVKATICGDGPEMELMRSLIDVMELQNNVTLTGELPHAGVLALMQRSKVLLHPSNYEGFSTVCLEALYAGAHVISFVRPMNADMPNWHIVTDKEDMLDRLISILQNTETSYSPVMPYPVHDNALAITALYHYNDSAIASNCPAMASNDSFSLK
jgi:glycosyltransferase involved in cell wall biosynthesis